MKLHFFRLQFIFICLIMTACSNNDEPEIFPIQFEREDYTIRFGVGTSISFVGGGGVYEMNASNPDILGKFYIDIETSRLIIVPASTGESALTITDIKTNSSTTLRFVVEDFYLAFIVDEIVGENTNQYLSVGNEIRFIRDKDNIKRLKIFRLNNLTHNYEYVTDGAFDIERSETNIFTLDMALHARPIEELEAFSYTMGGDMLYLDFFNKYFEYNWENSIVSKSQPVKQVQMILTDSSNGCKISCSLFD